MNESAITIEAEGESMLAILHHPPSDQDRKVGVVVVVGGAQYRVGSHRMFVTLARDLVGSGFTILRFDRRGMGDSFGTDRGFDDCNEDIQAAVKRLKTEKPDLSKVYLMGLCDGATAAAICNFKDDDISGYILINPWIRSPETEARILVSHYYKNRFMDRQFWRELLAGKVNLFQSIKEYFYYWSNSRSRRLVLPSLQSELFYRLKAAGKPTLFALSEKDITAQEFRAVTGLAPWKEWLALNADIRLIQFDGADHTFSSPSSMSELGHACSDWLQATSDV